MSLVLKTSINTFIVNIYKYITLSIFFILPNKVSNVFVSLSILSLIYDVRNIDLTDRPVPTSKFKTLLNISFNEEIMLLPRYTIHWFWKEKFLEERYTIGNESFTLREALIKDEILFTHLRFIVETLLQHIPKLLKFKLNLKNFKEYLVVKHNVMNLLIHA